MRYAGFWIRVVAALVDSVILSAANLGIMFLILGDFYIEFFRSIMAGRPMMPTETFTLQLLLMYLLQILVGWLYLAWFESSRHQATPGKMLLRLKVVDQQDQRLSFARATGRTFSKYLSSLICMIGWLMVAFTERKQGLHDIIAGTFVVPDEPSLPQ
jgi:uncharacterized RDD family membrane protein YckC